jgi:hypothetical protein
MIVNPYESPRVGEPFKERPSDDLDSMRQLLMDIRDDQRELLQLQRDAMLRVKRNGLFYFAFMLIPLAIMLVPMYFIRTMRSVPPTPVRAPRVFPSPIPNATKATVAEAPTFPN